jgi:hypothetical protein
MFILAPERDEDPKSAFERYGEYIRRESSRFPRGALALAASDWYFGVEDHRAPHDAWLVSAAFEETGTGARHQERALALRLRLLSAYHDQELEFFYPKVVAYTFQGMAVATGHGDWRYDEFRLDDAGQLIHEIQWHAGDERAAWTITSNDVVFTSRKVPSADQ